MRQQLTDSTGLSAVLLHESGILVTLVTGCPVVALAVVVNARFGVCNKSYV